MNGQIDFLTLIAVIVAAVAILKLRSVLGHRNSEDDARVERLKTRDNDGLKPASGPTSGEVISLPRRDRNGDAPSSPAGDTVAVDTAARLKAYPAVDAAVTDGLLAIAKYDPLLDPDAFLAGANQAYELIVTAFADGNRRALKDLLSRDVYDSFVAAIADRESRGQKIDQQFVGIRKSDILDAEVKDGAASLVVRFVSEIITAKRDKDGAVVEGDPQKIKEVTDIWTFSRDVSSKRALENLNWRLVATQAPN